MDLCVDFSCAACYPHNNLVDPVDSQKVPNCSIRGNTHIDVLWTTPVHRNTLRFNDIRESKVMNQCISDVPVRFQIFTFQYNHIKLFPDLIQRSKDEDFTHFNCFDKC